MRKALLLAVVFIVGLAPGAWASTGPHTETDRFFDGGVYDGARWVAGTHEYHFGGYFFNRGAWRSRVQDAFAEIDTISAFNIHIDWSGAILDQPGLNHNTGCTDIPPNWYSQVGTYSGGAGGAVAKTINCDRDSDGKLDFFAMWFNTDKTFNAADANDFNEVELQAVATHEGVHALGFEGHWGEGSIPGESLCFTSQIATWDLMCPDISVVYDYVWEDLDATDEHNAVMEFREGYPV